MGLMAQYWPLLYIASRIWNVRRWRQRQGLFRRRPDWRMRDWQEAIGLADSQGSDCQGILRDIGNHFGVHWRKLRPADGLSAELKIPNKRLHERMLGDFHDCIEARVLHRVDWEPELWPETPFDPEDWSVQELILYVLALITRCASCGYDLTGNVSGRCPECGEAIQPRE
jgi:hypothetical protein